MGTLVDSRGIPVRFGLAKGSGDLIGIKQIVITQEMVGSTIGQFWSVEVKTKKGKPTQFQLDWQNMVNKLGGYAEIVYS